VASRQTHLKACRLEHLNRGNRAFRMEIVIEGVRPEQDGVSSQRKLGFRASFSEPLFETQARKRGQLPAWRGPEHAFPDFSKSPGLGKKIPQPRCSAEKPCPKPNLSEGEVSEGSGLMFVVMREKLGFVGGYIHPHRAIALTSLAGEAQIK